MHSVLALLAPLALLVPTLGAERAPTPQAELLPQAAPLAVAAGETIEAVDPAEDPLVNQVRIEQRVTIRIVPRDPSIRPSLLGEMAPSPPVERKMGKCVPVSGIAAVQPEAGRLLLFMRDQRLVAASLEKACNARDFYRGFYLERTGDGLLCVERDKLHSRAGASCELSKMRQLVAAED